MPWRVRGFCSWVCASLGRFVLWWDRRGMVYGLYVDGGYRRGGESVWYGGALCVSFGLACHFCCFLFVLCCLGHRSPTRPLTCHRLQQAWFRQRDQPPHHENGTPWCFHFSVYHFTGFWSIVDFSFQTQLGLHRYLRDLWFFYRGTMALLLDYQLWALKGCFRGRQGRDLT